MKAPFWKTPYNHDTNKESDEHSVKEFGPSLTVQSQAEDADINVLMDRYGLTGKMPENGRMPSYVDFEDVIDFQSALAATQNANEAFMEYPAAMRAKFENNPQKFLEFCSNPANLPEMRSMGLAVPAPEIPATPVAATPP